MEPNESTGLSSYYHHQTVHPSTANPNAAAAAAAASNVVPTNGILPNAGNSSAAAAGGAASHMVYPGSMPSAVSSPMETVKRKRGRPRKYGTPEQAAAAKRMSSAASASNSLPKKRDQAALGGGGGQGGGGGSSYSLKKSQFAGDAGQGFTPHVVNVLAGEDVGNKIMTFMQQSKREICILSASGAVSSASLLQPSTSGGSVTYEGRFDILSLSGSYVNNGRGGKTGGLSVCLASSDGQIIGGGVGGPLKAAGQIQVIVGTFVVDSKRDITGGVRHETPAQFGVSPPMPGVGFQSGVNSSHQNMGGSQFMTQLRGMQPTPLQWRADASGQGVHQSPENGGFDHLGE
ncbi:PREDICTED: AT-hook motif nuclear-localized protein 14-like isoform X2 [Ipomoea nil]|uniref:AT-hook motif nuclear-localized protein 14-like isoform X2 n=1 Tax=Ipomoea nil TaxID=35883 RepID=UPI0009015DD7|nr:PREDICTED: AT-hook motif nuclear-localized protein 14-like isoform X2 [Ipomoea nil]